MPRIWRLYKTGFGLTAGFIGLQVSYTLITVHTLYNSQQLSLPGLSQSQTATD
jgi:hypothetical protein